MRLCRHDWIIHKTQKGHSIRHDLIIGGNEIPWFTLGLCYAMAFAFLNLSPIPIVGVILLSIVVGVVILGTLALTIGDFIDSDYDPWRSQDKSCLKCGKIKFDATDNKDKIDKRIEAKKLRDLAWQARRDKRTEKEKIVETLRNNNLKLAATRYQKLLKEHQEN